jgi:hypothetical protein
MKAIFFNSNERLRNGWWAALFLIALVLFGFAQVGVQWVCNKLHLPGGAWVHAIGTLAVLGATWSVLKLRQEPLATIGFDLDRRWTREFAWGSAIGIVQMLVAVLAVSALGGVRLEFDPARSLQAVGSGLVMFVLVSIKEETLFRGFLFQRLRDGIGLWPTQFLLASFFALAHWANPGMHGATKFWATLDIFIGALVFGMAYVRTGSLALPIGIHLGWNWMQGHVMGFGVSGNQFGHGWVKPIFLGKPEWMTGGTFGIEASIFAVVVDLTLLSLLLGWKGSKSSARIGG